MVSRGETFYISVVLKRYHDCINSFCILKKPFSYTKLQLQVFFRKYWGMSPGKFDIQTPLLLLKNIFIDLKSITVYNIFLSAFSILRQQKYTEEY